jgi:hypothetical protein
VEKDARGGARGGIPTITGKKELPISRTGELGNLLFVTLSP